MSEMSIHDRRSPFAARRFWAKVRAAMACALRLSVGHSDGISPRPYRSSDMVRFSLRTIRLDVPSSATVSVPNWKRWFGGETLAGPTKSIFTDPPLAERAPETVMPAPDRVTVTTEPGPVMPTGTLLSL